MKKEYSELEKDIIRQIGYAILKYYADKDKDMGASPADEYDMVASFISRMGITNISVSVSPDWIWSITITLHRPGLLIGKQGVVINFVRDSIEKYLTEKENKKCSVVIDLEEDTLYDYLIPVDYSEWSDYE